MALPVAGRRSVPECDGQNYCLNEGAFFLIISGFWTGLYYFLKVYISEKHLTFPVIYQRKVLQLKARILPLLKESFALSLWPTFYFTILYWCWGGDLTYNFNRTFGILENAKESMPSLIYLHLWMFGAIYYFNMSLMRFFFNLFLTEPVEFPLFKETPESLCLQESITLQDLPIVQSLACLDLHSLAQWSKSRRQAFFSLSQPGGHPHNWNSLIENVLKLLNEYTEVLNKSVESPELSKPVQVPAVPPCAIRPPDRFRNLRNMCLTPPDPGTIDVEISHSPLPGFGLPSVLAEKLKQKFQAVLNVIKMLLGINFLFGELPQASVQKCLANGHIIVWISQGVSVLACASIAEDRYGIVQKDLPGIITTLQGLDRLNKMPALARKMAGYDDFNYRMKGAVTSAVKRSLFNLCMTFSAYMKEFPLGKDVVLYLQTVYKA
ncbi:hypothetical protein NQ318_002716 [Aromia moschata]|uniref:Nucleoporin NDC1 n=1 Tax=Aromia moschata TaxID=1265417 RepID=A0AAV8Y380_9CUCU|nr:hypothetical protein NQ318_002716 [Aromia moschata]